MSKFVTLKKIIEGKQKSNLLFLFYRNFMQVPLSCMFSEKFHLSISYRLKFKKKIDWQNPQTFNEKLQWLKLHDRNPLYTKLVDKYEVRDYINHTIGEEYLVPLLGVYNHVDDISFDSLPNQFVLKCTHDSGNVIICRGKESFNYLEAKERLKKAQRRNFYYCGREWPYKNIKPRIICEELLVDESGYELKDYKIYCYHGEPKIIQVMSNRSKGGYNLNHYDLDWNEIIIERKNHKPNPNLAKPILLQEMVEVSRKLSKDIPFVRVDLYYTGDKIYFGEMTFFPASGYNDYVKESDDLLHGSWLDLSSITSK